MNLAIPSLFCLYANVVSFLPFVLFVLPFLSIVLSFLPFVRLSVRTLFCTIRTQFEHDSDTIRTPLNAMKKINTRLQGRILHGQDFLLFLNHYILQG